MYIRMASGDTWKLADIEQVVGYLGMFSPHFGYLNPIYYVFFSIFFSIFPSPLLLARLGVLQRFACCGIQ